MNEQTQPVNNPLAKKSKKRSFFRLLVNFPSIKGHKEVIFDFLFPQLSFLQRTGIFFSQTFKLVDQTYV
jgi:hypothetical protein